MSKHISVVLLIAVVRGVEWIHVSLELNLGVTCAASCMLEF